MTRIQYCWVMLAVTQFPAVLHAAIKVGPSTLPEWTVTAPYSQALSATGCAPICEWSSSGQIPPGLSLDAASGVLSGTPVSAGSFEFTVSATNIIQTGSQDYTVVIHPAPQISTTSLPAGQTGAAYAQTIAGTGGTPPYAFSVGAGALPTGLSLDSSRGVISGSPSASGSFNFTILLTDHATAKASEAYTLSITSPVVFSIATGSPLPNGAVGAAYSQVLSVSGGTAPYSWSLAEGSLPDGISLGPAGTLIGTPTANGAFTFTVQVTDSKGATASKQLSLTIATGVSPLSITTSSLPAGSAGAAYSQTLSASGGTPPYSWSVIAGSLPSGLTLTSASGGITGNPAGAGTSTFTVRVTDHAGKTADQALSITIGAATTSPTLSLAGVPSSASSAQQITLDVALSSTMSSSVTGQVTLSFQPNATVAQDDPGIQFAGGGRTANFTIPANSTHAVFAVSPMAFQTGTVAGVVTLAVHSSLPGGNLSQAVTVARAAPVVQTASVVVNASGFQVQVAGFSNSRDLTSASFHFTAAAGQIVQTSDLIVPLSSAASQWYLGSSSTSFGGQFLIVVPFTIQQGASAGLSSVGVQLQNSQNTSAAVTANF